jgi:hypothetical protein
MQSNIANLMGSDLTTQQRNPVDLQTEIVAVFFSGNTKQEVNHD